MKAVLLKKFGGIEELYVGEAPDPIISNEEVLVKVHATALNRADLLQRKGLYPPPPGESEILGLEMAGEIATVGSQVNNWKKGDRVLALLAGGGYAEYVKVHQDMLISIPDSMTYTQAAAIAEAFLTAYQSVVWLADLKAGETILVHAGASGVGTAATQLAKQIGATVYTTASLRKHETCQKMGADLCINYKEESFEEVVLRNKPTGVDVVIDFIGAPYFSKNLKALGMDGRMVMLGFLGGVKTAETNLAPILFKRLKIMGSTLRARTLAYKIELTRAFADDYFQLFEKGQLLSVVDSVYDWENVRQAHEYMEKNKNMGKIILKVK